MESSSLLGDFPSPESTVTSLLSSSGHLRSSLRPPEHNTTFRYRDKDYDSASAALDAYIADFERSESSTGTLGVPHNLPSMTSRPRVSMLRNKDVLRERLTDRELDFLNLPVSSLHHHGNRDRLSMTTDELLSIPSDGSMPVTHTSAFLQGLLSQSRTSQPHPSSSRPAHKSCAGLGSLSHHPPPTRTPKSSSCRGRPGVDISPVRGFKLAHTAVRLERTEPSSLLHLPHWFTSNKADMDCSGITSVPDLKYPAWIQNCDLSEPPLPSTESELWDDHAPRTGAPSWVEDLEEEEDPDQTHSQVGSHLTLRDLRLQFAEQISLLAAEGNSSAMKETLFRDNRIECLIQKADQVLTSLSQSSGGAESPADPVSSAALSPSNTEELLLCSPSRCPPFTLASAAGGVTVDQTLRGTRTQSCNPHENSTWKQPGPVEALKQMLFRLQAVETELQRQQQQQKAAAVTAAADRLHTPAKQWPEGEAELQAFSGRPSLQKALHHLSRLKLLVEESQKETQRGRGGEGRR